jgi:hypothetical protein
MFSRIWNTCLLLLPVTGAVMALGFTFTLFAPGALGYAPFLIPMVFACSVPMGLILSWKFAPALGRWLRSPNSSVEHHLSAQRTRLTGRLSHADTHALPRPTPDAPVLQLVPNVRESGYSNNPFPPADRPLPARRSLAYPLQQRDYADWLA